MCFYVTHAYPLVIFRRILKFSLCVFAMGSDVNIEKDLPHRLVKRFIYNNSDLIFAVSSEIKREIKEDSDCRVIIIPSSADPSFFRPLCSRIELRRKWGFIGKSRIILTVCRLDKNKGVDVLIRSLQMLDCDDFCLLIAGDGTERESLEELAGILGFKERVKFLGFQNREELLELYNLADLFVLASYSEGLPRVLIEAMACGCIPVVTNVGDAAAVVRDGFNGFIVDPGDHERLGERIKQTLSLPEETMKVIQNRARRIVENGFDSRRAIKKMVDSISALFEKSSTCRI
jgi:glycosyltransferase involved in cell wall biosynthesis